MNTNQDSGQLERIVTQLTDKTQKRTIRWKWEDKTNVVSATYHNFIVRIVPGLLSPTLQLFNASGQSLANYGGKLLLDSGLASLFVLKGAPPTQRTSVSQLYEIAKRNATGIDDQLDALEKALDEK